MPPDNLNAAMNSIPKRPRSIEIYPDENRTLSHTFLVEARNAYFGPLGRKFGYRYNGLEAGQNMNAAQVID